VFFAHTPSLPGSIRPGVQSWHTANDLTVAQISVKKQGGDREKTPCAASARIKPFRVLPI
jgi:hypothetical protein